jgi:hypothetical protein
MRLRCVANGIGWPRRALFSLVKLFTGMRVPDIVPTLLYRSEFFGRPFSELVHEVLRGRSAWSAGERELFAAFVSQLNRCRF